MTDYSRQHLQTPVALNTLRNLTRPYSVYTQRTGPNLGQIFGGCLSQPFTVLESSLKSAVYVIHAASKTSESNCHQARQGILISFRLIFVDGLVDNVFACYF